MSSVHAFRTCPVGRYHWYQVLFTDDKEQREVCRFCKKIEVYKFSDNGKLVDDMKYYKDHIRAFAQPSMAVYHDIYPEMEAKLIAEAGAEKFREEMNKQRSEDFKAEIKKILKA